MKEVIAAIEWDVKFVNCNLKSNIDMMKEVAVGSNVSVVSPRVRFEEVVYCFLGRPPPATGSWPPTLVVRPPAAGCHPSAAVGWHHLWHPSRDGAEGAPKAGEHCTRQGPTPLNIPQEVPHVHSPVHRHVVVREVQVAQGCAGGHGRGEGHQPLAAQRIA